jgi:uncharacterized protein (TIGR02300 family)
MAKKVLGNKYVCYQCGCKFYDLGRPQPLCPKCGADQNEAQKKDPVAAVKAATPASVGPRLRGRGRRPAADEGDSFEVEEPFSDDDTETGEALEDGLSMIDDDELLEPGPDDFSGED